MAVVTFLSDYGLDDDFVGVCHGVIARIAPDVRVIDITHGIARHDVRAGALVLRRALGYMPAGVHLAVVDPGVGSARGGVALRCAGDERRVLVGPDNGLLTLAARDFGGVAEAVDIGASPFALQPLSASFHGRDVFAPVAAHLAGGSALADVGRAIDPGEARRARASAGAQAPDGLLVAHVLHADRYGNVMLDAQPLRRRGERAAAPATPSSSMACERRTRRRSRTSPAGGLLLYEDSDGALSLAINRGSALDALGLGIDGRVEIAAGVSVRLGTPRLHLRTTDSTNERARALAIAGAPHGMLVTAGEQSAGRGRQGRTWSAPPGRALLLSLVLRDVPALLALASAVAVADVAGPDATIKWPNDVLLGGRKVAGILAEGRPREGWAVLGIGVNVAVRASDLPAELAGRAAGLGLQPADVERVLAELLAALELRLSEPPGATARRLP